MVTTPDVTSELPGAKAGLMTARATSRSSYLVPPHREALENTHSRYFGSVRELTQA
jgi:hypothetical protein